MRRRIFKMLIIVGLPFAASLFFYHRLTIFFPGNSIVKQKMDYLYLREDRPDILFLGSSRAMNQIDPRVVDSVCGVKSYNLGLNAFNIAEMRMQLRVLLANGKAPRVLAVNLDPSSFNTGNAVYSFPEILPYAERDSVIRNSMAGIQDVYAWRWKYSFYKWEALSAVEDGLKVNALLEGKEYRKAKAIFDKRDADDAGLKGFVPVYEPYSETYVNPFMGKADEKGFQLLRDIVHLCREKNIQPVFFTGPMYKDYRRIFLNAGEVLARVAEILREEHAPYFNMADDPQYRERANYFNFVHLNGWAAERFSLQLAGLLRDSTGGMGRPVSF